MKWRKEKNRKRKIWYGSSHTLHSFFQIHKRLLCVLKISTNRSMVCSQGGSYGLRERERVGWSGPLLCICIYIPFRMSVDDGSKWLKMNWQWWLWWYNDCVTYKEFFCWASFIIKFLLLLLLLFTRIIFDHQV